MEKTCKTCIYFPCTKPQCLINKEACNDYESTVSAISKEMEEER